MRENGRKPDQLREISFDVDYLENPHGSVVITAGKTKVLCTAMVEEDIPRWLRGQGKGWITAEYSLLPASTGDRVQREASRGKSPSSGGTRPGKSPSFSRATMICATISRVVRSRTSFCVPVWQKLQVSVQPTWLEMHKVPRSLSGI